MSSLETEMLIENGYRVTAEDLGRLGSTMAKILFDVSVSAVRTGVKKILSSTSSSNHGTDTRVENARRETLVIWLVHPTNYRPDGSPRKWKKQILPTNAIGQLYALMPKFVLNEHGENVPIEVHFLEDTVQPFDIQSIAESLKGEHRKGIVMLVGVQTNQWPRAKDLARLCKARGIPVIAGGYHVRADLPITEREANELGMSLAVGEAEATLEDSRLLLSAVVEDCWHGKLEPVYRQTANPSIAAESLSIVVPEYQQLMVSPNMSTLETSRGCPLPCSFCTIRTIGGTTVRARTPDQMEAWLRENFQRNGIRGIFVTDDNFARSHQRFEVLEIFARLRKQGLPIGVMLQVDTMATEGKEGAHFLDSCQKAGVYTVFLGIESVDPETLKGMNKPQNHPDRYRDVMKAWHSIGSLTQCGFIIGSPTDTVGVGKRSAQTLIEMGMDVAAVYILTPLPGSVDYHNFHGQGFIQNSDFNAYDSHTAPCLAFPGGLSPEQVMEEYRAFYRTFYCLPNLLRLARRLRGHTLENAARQWLWYAYAVRKGDHPMFSGIGKVEPDFYRQDFGDGVLPTVADLAPKPNGPGAPEKRRLPLASLSVSG